MTNLEPLLDLQERDLALDRLRHRHATLPERAALATAVEQVATLTRDLEAVRAERDGVAAEERRLDDEAQGIAAQASGAEQKLYSGEISSPKELQALQADVEQLRRHQRQVEDRQIETMERREPLDGRVGELEAALASAESARTDAEAALAAAVAAVEAEVALEAEARAKVAAPVSPDLLATYERCREKGNGVGAARLVGGTCQGCHLSVPSTEVDTIRHAPPDQVSYCDNCGCILVITG